MEPAGPERRNHKLLGRSSHCQRKVLPSRPMTRKQWKHKTNKALKDLFPTVLSRGTIRQNQMNIKPGLIEMRSTGYLLCTDHSPMDVQPAESWRICTDNVLSFLQHNMQRSFQIF